MKKIISLLFAVLLLGALSLSAYAQEVSDAPTLVVSTEQAMPGEEVAVAISILNNPGVGVINPKFEFDSSRLEWIGYENGGFTGWTVTEKAGVWLGNQDSRFNGVILTLRFRIPESAPNGFAAVRLLCGDGDAYNYAEEPISFVLVEGGVQVGEAVHAHTPAPETRENEIAPGCTRTGSYDLVVLCSECGEEISRTTVPVPATGHSYGPPRFDWREDYSAAAAIFICSQRDDVIELEAAVESRTVSSGTEYTASVSFQGTLYSETKTVTADGGQISAVQNAAPAPGAEASPDPAVSPAAAPDKAADGEASPSPIPTAAAAPEAAPEADPGEPAPSEAAASVPGSPVLSILLICCVLAALVLLFLLRVRKRKAE